MDHEVGRSFGRLVVVLLSDESRTCMHVKSSSHSQPATKTAINKRAMRCLHVLPCHRGLILRQGKADCC